MTVRIIDRNEQQLTVEQTKNLNIWNSTMSHVCASVMERIREGKVTTATSLKIHKGCDKISSALLK